jgi:putative FmdB family regulatory protein
MDAMPLYDYRCPACNTQFEARHGFHAPTPACPACGAVPQRIITTAPAQLNGMVASAGHGGTASKEQLRAKWAEETPRLREKLVSKLGEDTVNRYAPSLNTRYD